MNDEIKKTLHAAVLRLLRPLVRLLLHHNVPYETFADLAKWVYVDIAGKEFQLPGKKQTTSRVSVITGLHRKEVARLQAMDVADTTAAIASFNRAEKVVTAWLQDARADDKSSSPRPLPLEGEKSFSTLVKRYSGDMPVRAVLDELVRVGVVERTQTGEIALLNQGSIVPEAGNRADLLNIFGQDASDFLSTNTHNVLSEGKERFFQRSIWTDNIPVEHLEAARNYARHRGEELNSEFTTKFSELDRDTNPAITGTGKGRAVFGIYYFQEVTEDTNPPETVGAKK